jgi:hypothetical protein
MANIIQKRMCITNEITSCHKYDTVWYIKQKKTTEKPSSYAIKDAVNKNNKVVVKRQLDCNRAYSSYSTPEKVVEVINKNGNINLYELLTPEQPVNIYLDIEFPAVQINPQTALITVVHFIKKLVVEIFGVQNSFDDEDIHISGSIGTGKIENVEVEKASYHVVLPCQQTFKSVADLKKFMNYVRFRIDNPKDDDEKEEVGNLTYVLKDNIKRVIDFQVYGKNQCMKLPKQSKYGSDRVQEPFFKNDNLLNHFCGNYEDIEYLEFFDVSKVPIFQPTQNEVKRKTLLGRNTNYITTSNIHADFRPKECIPKEHRSLSLHYILNSIDNTDQDYNVWFGVACAVKNCCDTDKQGFQLFSKWCEKSSKNDNEQNLQLWNRIEKKEKGYNKGTLIKLAQRCNPRMEQKRGHDFITPLVHCDPKFNTCIYNEKYARPYPYQQYECIISESPMGSGKTFQIGVMLKKMGIEGKRVLILAPRQCFAKSICGELNRQGFDFKCYLDVKDKKTLSSIDYLVCQMESLHYLQGSYDIVIADEFVSCLTQFSSTVTMRGKIDKVVNSFINIWKNANFKLVCDAFIDPKTLKFIEYLEKRKKEEYTLNDCFAGIIHTPYDHVLFMKNEVLPEERKAFQLKRETKRVDGNKITTDKLQDHMIESLRNGKKCIFVTASKQRGEEFLNRMRPKLPHIKYKFYNSNNYDDRGDLLDVNTHWNELDLLMYTSSITVGVNFDIEHFDLLYVYSSCKSSCVRDIFQSTMRVRHIKDKTMYFQLFDSPFGLDTDIVDNWEDIKNTIIAKVQRENTFESQMVNGGCDVKTWKDMPSWLFDVHVYNVYENNISILHHNSLFRHYLSRCNYSYGNCNDIDGEDFEALPLDFCRYNQIEYNDIDVMYLEQKAQKEFHLFTDTEKNKWCKYKFDQQITENAERAKLYDYFFDPANYKRGNYFQLLFEKRYSYENSANKEKDEVVYAQFSNQKTLRLKCVRDLLGILGVNSSTDKNKVFLDYELESKYEQIMEKKEEWKQVFKLRDRVDDDKKISKNREITDLVSAVLSKWSGSTLKAGKKTTRKVDGIRRQVKRYNIHPPLDIDVIGMFEN